METTEDKLKVQKFADGEFGVTYEESIRGCYVFLVQSTFPNSDNLMELVMGMLGLAGLRTMEKIKLQS